MLWIDTKDDDIKAIILSQYQLEKQYFQSSSSFLWSFNFLETASCKLSGSMGPALSPLHWWWHHSLVYTLIKGLYTWVEIGQNVETVVELFSLLINHRLYTALGRTWQMDSALHLGPRVTKYIQIVLMCKIWWRHDSFLWRSTFPLLFMPTFPGLWTLITYGSKPKTYF